ncbi:MAG: TIGR00269 family protein [Candidatus Heimdallarchaeaceae archaeon]
MRKMKRFIRNFEDKVKNTIDRFNLITKDDRIIVACSGGKDSTTVLYLLNKLGYKTEAMFIDLHLGDYSKGNQKNVRMLCENNKIKLHELSLRGEFGCSVCYIRSVLKSKNIIMRSCKICAILRRWLLNRKARELKATKLVTGHNLDDEVETILMNYFNGNINLLARMGPVTGVIRNKKFVPRVKPLYFCTNEETTKYSRLMHLPVLYERCPCSVDAYRGYFRGFIKEIEEYHPGTKEKIVKDFLKLLPEFKKFSKKNKRINYCEACGEPSSKNLCNACQIMKQLME